MPALLCNKMVSLARPGPFRLHVLVFCCMLFVVSVLTTSLRCSCDSSGPLSLGIERNHCRAASTLQAADLLGANSVGGSGNSLLSWAQRRMSYPPGSLLGTFGPANSITCQENSGPPSSYPPNSPSTCRRLSRDVYGNPMFSTCSKCGGKYTNPSVCASHEAVCNGTNRLKCHICRRVYSQMCALKEHLRGKHGLGEMLTCRLCGRSFKYKPQLYDHSCSGLNPRDKQSLRSPHDLHTFASDDQHTESADQPSTALVKTELIGSQP